MNVSAVVLAAGYSKRMGVLKPLLPVGNTCAITRAVALLEVAGVSSIIVVTGFRHEEIEAELLQNRKSTVKAVFNGAYADGMFSSVKAGVAALPEETDAFFLIPADHCAVKPETLIKTLEAYASLPSPAIFYPTCGGKHGHPPLISARLREGLLHHSGREGLNGYLHCCPKRDVPVCDQGIHLDMDTPADYEALLRHLGLPVFPDRATCEALLIQYGTPEKAVQHGREVAVFALQIADLLAKRGLALDTELLYAAALLHDMLRELPDHAEAAARALLQEGYPAASAAVGLHMELPPERAAVTDEAAVLYLSDKVMRRGVLTPLSKRLSELSVRFADDPEALSHARARMARAQEILTVLENRYGITPAELGLEP